ncbi:hypothetical protein WN51_12783 [Melipona quadrifasciata]|uniref:Uncharacterized protein n=1 Tax=Melipona quadrifasciata TaxID=166423 RepID=A0A0N0U5M5_9HYME|nr:hypothetical protein WN51_12783 [Melipona quadrifasciata]
MYEKQDNKKIKQDSTDRRKTTPEDSKLKATDTLPMIRNLNAPVLENEYTLKESNNYIPVNHEYLNTHCRKSPIGKICEITQSMTHLVTENYDPTDKCKTALFKIVKITFVPLQDHNKYLAIPENSITVQTICETMRQIEITEPSILTAKIDCIMTYDNHVMKFGGIVGEKETKIKITNYSLDIPFDKYDMRLIHDFLPVTKQITPDYKIYENSFDRLNNQLENFRNQRRILTTTKIIINIFKYLGYILGIVTIYLLHKMGIFRCVSNLAPKNVCIKLCCNETTISNDAQPRVVYTHNSGNPHEMEIQQINNRQHGQSLRSPEEEISIERIIIGQPKIFKFIKYRKSHIQEVIKILNYFASERLITQSATLRVPTAIRLETLIAHALTLTEYLSRSSRAVYKRLNSVAYKSKFCLLLVRSVDW